MFRVNVSRVYDCGARGNLNDSMLDLNTTQQYPVIQGDLEETVREMLE